MMVPAVALPSNFSLRMQSDCSPDSSTRPVHMGYSDSLATAQLVRASMQDRNLALQLQRLVPRGRTRTRAARPFQAQRRLPLSSSPQGLRALPTTSVSAPANIVACEQRNKAD
eukprot:Blabericola_migrator_1__7190@NODE_3648_length_1604_cov_42_653871_g2261_i0_p2_GENE_NODE_3648_length_1604_cov_42_653871_g2261_i0NODE_3648_length_1604_cov_42_653871_g2261_i0_p2_ORF_typecomplete_len113_score4_97_NODE_3648_length_1604_cov_42_653871_g2261_i0454792